MGRQNSPHSRDRGFDSPRLHSPSSSKITGLNPSVRAVSGQSPPLAPSARSSRGALGLRPSFGSGAASDTAASATHNRNPRVSLHGRIVRHHRVLPPGARAEDPGDETRRSSQQAFAGSARGAPRNLRRQRRGRAAAHVRARARSIHAARPRSSRRHRGDDGRGKVGFPRGTGSWCCSHRTVERNDAEKRPEPQRVPHGHRAGTAERRSSAAVCDALERMPVVHQAPGRGRTRTPSAMASLG